MNEGASASETVCAHRMGGGGGGRAERGGETLL